MVFTESELQYGFAVFAGTVSFVAVPGIVGKFFVQLAHVVIPPGFGKDAGGGDGCIGGVALDDAAVGGAAVFYKPIAIDEEKPGAKFQLVEGQVHGFERGFKNIDLVYLFMIYHSYCIIHGVGFDVYAQFLPVFGGHLFGVVEQRMIKSIREDDGSGENRSGVTASACLITTRFS